MANDIIEIIIWCQTKLLSMFLYTKIVIGCAEGRYTSEYTDNSPMSKDI